MNDNYRNQIITIMKDCDKKYEGLYCALIVWKDPICKGRVSHRSMASDEYVESEEWINERVKQYDEYGFPYISYLNGEQYKTNGEW